VIVCVPVVNVLSTTEATPFVTVEVPIVVEPSVNVTVPVTAVGRVAVKVTGWSAAEGFSEEVRPTVGVDFVTVTIVAGEVAGLLFASPGVLAVIGSLPTGRFVTVMVATPPTTGAVPIGVPPSEKVTGPETPGGTVSVIVSLPPEGIVGEETTGGGSTGVTLFTICVSGAEVAAP